MANGILKFLLHAADISNPAKKHDLAGFWADRALKEFFAQGIYGYMAAAKSHFFA